MTAVCEPQDGHSLPRVRKSRGPRLWPKKNKANSNLKGVSRYRRLLNRAPDCGAEQSPYLKSNSLSSWLDGVPKKNRQTPMLLCVPEKVLRMLGAKLNAPEYICSHMKILKNKYAHFKEI